MKGIGFKLLPFVVIVLFIAVMTTGFILKQPFSENDDVMFHIDHVKKHVQEEDWEEAKEQLKKTQSSWKKVVRRIQFSAERDEINTLKRNMKRTQGFIVAEDKAGALAELAEAEYIWTELGK